jgi:hypothetical protein
MFQRRALLKGLLILVMNFFYISATFADPVKVFPGNPHYLMYKGKPILLITSDEAYGAVVNSEFDYVAYLDKLHSKGMNFARIYPGGYIEQPGDFAEGNPLGVRPGKHILPWARSAVKGANPTLGEYKYDLDRWDEAYFTRLKDFCKKAYERDIIVEICFFNGQYNPEWLKGTGGWLIQAIYKDNNIQGVGNCSWDMAQSINGDPELLKYQAIYIMEITKRLNDFDNVMFHICDEPWVCAKSAWVYGVWVGKMIDAYESAAYGLPKKHILGQTVDYRMRKNDADFSEDSRIGYIDIEYVRGRIDLRDEYVHNKPIVLIETGHYPGYKGDKISACRVEAWEFMLGGCAGFMHMNGLYTTDNPTAAGTEIDSLLDIYVTLGKFIRGFNYTMMKRDTSFVASGVPADAFTSSLSEPGNQYAFYIHHSEFDKPKIPHTYIVVPGKYKEELAFNIPAGKYRAEWVNPTDGSVIKSEEITHKNGLLNLSTPVYSIDIALRIKNTGTPGLAPQSMLPGKVIQTQVKKPENPVSISYLQKNLIKKTPRLILDVKAENAIRAKLKNDQYVKSLYRSIKLQTEEILKKPVLTRIVTGRRLLGVSSEFSERACALGMVYRIEKDPAILKRIDDELKAVCSFSDWNPSHFLDVAVMSLGVAIAIDWAGQDLPKATVDLATNALIEKGLKASYAPGNTGDFRGIANHNQVDNGGMVAAALVVAEKDPELSARVLSRALNGIPIALDAYAPDGAYPEGPGYWDFGTSYTVLTSCMLTTALGTDFGISAFPGFMESARFRLLTVSPANKAYNYGDNDDSDSKASNTLLWFALKTGNPAYFDREYFAMNPEERGPSRGFAPMSLIWLAQFEPKDSTPLPLIWKGNGTNPIVIFRGDEKDPGKYYFGAKGGRASIGHGNMDAGSFIFELDGVRWVVDPGSQNYNELEKTGFKLWDICQDCERYVLLTKGNHGHSTLTVNDSRHKFDGFAPITSFREGPVPEAIFDLTDIFGGTLKKATRRFVKESSRSLLIEDNFEMTDLTKNITWALMTTADVEITEKGAILKQSGKTLNLEILSPANLKVSVISMDPPPLKLDKRIENLKRLEIRIPAYYLNGMKGEIKVRLIIK